MGEAINVIAVGRPGAGKSHLLAALGHAILLCGHPVFWTSTASLVQRLLAALRNLAISLLHRWHVSTITAARQY